MKVTILFSLAFAFAIASEKTRCNALSMSTNAASKRVTVFGGTGFVGSAVCSRLVKKGYDVTALSRRGENPKPNDEWLSQVTWVKGDATNYETVANAVAKSDAAVHAIGLLFDVNSGLENLNKIVSGSQSLPGADSTYDNITRLTMFNLIKAISSKPRLPFVNNERFPLCFVSAAEAGWPDMAGGSLVEEKFAPDWLKRYLIAKRAVEDKLGDIETSKIIKSAIYRPSLIWDWTKVSGNVVYFFTFVC